MSFVNFCYYKRGDQYRSYNVLFKFKTLPNYKYLWVILINTISCKSAFTNEFTTSSCKVSRLNFAAKARRTCRDIIARIMALVGKS